MTEARRPASKRADPPASLVAAGEGAVRDFYAALKYPGPDAIVARGVGPGIDPA